MARVFSIARLGAFALFLSLGVAWIPAVEAIPATRLMTVYRFNGPPALPYYDIDDFLRRGAKNPAGTLAQGSSVIPCVAVRDGKPVTDKSGTPFVGFEVVVDASDAGPDATERFERVWQQRKSLRVPDHRCSTSVRHVIDVRRLFALGKAPRFEPSGSGETGIVSAGRDSVDAVVRAFHASAQCRLANRRLLDRRDALARAWDSFISERNGRWPRDTLRRAKHLDYVMRTAIYEGHLDRGCSAYGSCERNVVALSIRNRALERCQSGQGCAFPGDFQGVASKVSQYNIWDELLTQTSGLTGCFLRPDLANVSPYARLRAMYAQNAGAVERILFGGDAGLSAVFPDSSLAEMKKLRHYYHPPAMGKCFPAAERIEYISGAIATRGSAHALIANTRVRVDAKSGRGYRFRAAKIDARPDGDVINLADDYAGFVIDGRKVALRNPKRCTPFGTPRGCRFDRVGRRRKVPPWLARGAPLQLRCQVQATGEGCDQSPLLELGKVGGVCDVEMQPIAGVP